MSAPSKFKNGQKEYKKEAQMAQETKKMHLVGRRSLFDRSWCVRLLAVLCCWVDAPVVAAGAFACPLSNSTSDQTAISLWTSCTCSLVLIKPSLNGSLATPCADGRYGWSCQNAGCEKVYSQKVPWAACCVFGRSDWPCQHAECTIDSKWQNPFAAPCVDGHNEWQNQNTGCETTFSQNFPWTDPCVDECKNRSGQNAGCDVDCSWQVPRAAPSADGRFGWPSQHASCDADRSWQTFWTTPCVCGRKGWPRHHAGCTIDGNWHRIWAAVGVDRCIGWSLYDAKCGENHGWLTPLAPCVSVRISGSWQKTGCDVNCSLQTLWAAPDVFERTAWPYQIADKEAWWRHGYTNDSCFLPPVNSSGFNTFEFWEFREPPKWLWVVGFSSWCTAFWIGRFSKRSKRKRPKKRNTPNVDLKKRLKLALSCKWHPCRRVQKTRVKQARLRQRRIAHWLRNRFVVKQGTSVCRPDPEQPLTTTPTLKNNNWVFFQGGAAGSAVTKRKQSEKFLLDGLKQLLSQIGTSNETETTRGRSPSRGETISGFANGSQSPRGRSRSPSPGWTLKGNRKGKSKDKGKGHGLRPTSPSPDTRRVQFVEERKEQGSSLIAQLKALVLAAETNDTKDLLAQLKKLVERFSENESPNGQQQRQQVNPKQCSRGPVCPPKNQQQDKTTQKPKNSNPPRIDRTWWKDGIHGLKKLTESLEQGEICEGGTITPCSCAEAKALRELAKAHNLSNKFALLCYDIRPEDTEMSNTVTATKKWVRLTGGRWRQYWISPLTKELPTWAQEPEVDTIAKEAIPVEEELTSFRVTFVKNLLTNQQWETAVKKPLQLLVEALPEGSNARGYGWHQIPDHEVVMGTIKTPKKYLEQILSSSGHRHAFFTCIDKDHERKHVQWIRTEEGQNPFQYYAEAKKRAREEGVGLALKRGKRNNLGLIGIKTITGEEGLIRRKWVIRGAPSWTPETMRDFLTKQNWRIVDDIVPPARKNGLWTFLGVAPRDKGSVGYVINVNDHQLVFTPWTPKPQKHQSLPINHATRWVSVCNQTEKQKNTGDTEDLEEKDKVSATVLDTQRDSNSDVEMLNPGEKRGAADSPPTKKPCKQARRTDGKGSGSEGNNGRDPPKTGPQGVSVWDLKGAGNCGFRCLAAINAIRDKRKPTKDDVENMVEKLAITLRTKTVGHLKQDDSWTENWWADSDCTVQTEDGAPAKNLQQYYDVMGRPNKWMDTWTAYGAASVLRSDVLVWRYKGDRWNFVTRIQPLLPAVNKTPMVLFLRNGHFTTIDPNAPFPKEWLTLGKQNADQFHSHSLAGGGWLSPKSSRHSQDLDSDGNGSSWLKPQFDSLTSNPTDQGAINTAQATSSTIAGDVQTLDQLITGRRIIGKQPDLKKAFISQDFEWNCPVCHLKITRDTAESLHGVKQHHLLSRHPSFNRDLVKKEKRPDIIVPSKDIPKADRHWSCPLCDVGLYAMPPQDMKRAINEHCRTTHPNETRRSLCNLSRKGRPNLGVSKNQLEKHEANRPVLFGSHDVILLPQETKDAAVDRGRVSFCRKCLWKLSKIGHGGYKDVPCDDVVKELTNNPWKRKMKRDWWNRLQTRDPEYALNFLKASGWTKEGLDQFLAPTYKNEAAKRAGEKRKLQLEQLRNTKKHKKSTL